MQPHSDEHSDAQGQSQQATVTAMPISGTTYTKQLMGEGYQTYQITAK